MQKVVEIESRYGTEKVRVERRFVDPAHDSHESSPSVTISFSIGTPENQECSTLDMSEAAATNLRDALAQVLVPIFHWEDQPSIVDSLPVGQP